MTSSDQLILEAYREVAGDMQGLLDLLPPRSDSRLTAAEAALEQAYDSGDALQAHMQMVALFRLLLEQIVEQDIRDAGV